MRLALLSLLVAATGAIAAGCQAQPQDAAAPPPTEAPAAPAAAPTEAASAHEMPAAQAPAAAPAPTEPANAAVRQVEAKYVCMINNTLFPKEQIPVPVDGKTYYGCCQMCEQRLGSDPGSRMAVDPVSGKAVDKATATIGATPDGQVLYFESPETLAAYGK